MYAEDINHVHTLVHDIWRQAGHNRIPFIIGPASNFNQNAYPFMLTIGSGDSFS